MYNVTLAQAAKKLSMKACDLRDFLMGRGLVFRDAQLRIRTTPRGMQTELVTESIGHFWHPGLQRYQQYAKVMITPKGQRWLQEKFANQNQGDSDAKPQAARMG